MTMRNTAEIRTALNTTAQTPLQFWLEHGMAGIWLDERNTYLARAADGAVVQLGRLGDERSINAYLTAHPNPADW